MKKVGIFYRLLVDFYRHLVYFAAIWKILWTFGTFCGNLYITAIWYMYFMALR
jgi:hypothetical protein